MDLFNSENYKNESLNTLLENDKLIKYNLMSEEERKFFNGVLHKLQPKKIVEIGVAAGGSSAVILNAIKDIDGSQLYSIDLVNNQAYADNKPTGFLVDEEFPNLKSKWKLYTGGMAFDFIEDIGDGIDFVLLDAAHNNPGEILDFLVVYPFLKENAAIVIHDTQLHTFNSGYAETCCVLFSALVGEKYYPLSEQKSCGISNIGCVILDKAMKDNLLNIFLLITLRWNYLLDLNMNSRLLKFLNKYYDSSLVNIYEKSFIHYYNSIMQNGFNQANNTEVAKLEIRLNKLIDYIAWWIPVKKWRNNFRNKILG